MKIKSRFKGKEHDIPMQLQKAFHLNNGISSAKLKIDYLGNYSLTVPYNVSEATARRSIYYKPTMEELTQQMMNAYTDSTFAFSHIVSKCHTIETDILYQKRLNNLRPETYSKKFCSEPQPTRNAVEKELIDEANQKYYSLLGRNKSAKKKYVSDNIESVYNERLRHWEEVVTYFDYVESVIEAKKNKEFHDKYILEKTNLENHLFGPDSYVKKQLNEILNDENIPLSTLPFDLFYDQKKELIEIIVDVPFDLPVPKETAQLYASGKLWLKSKAGKDIVNEKILFYLGLQFYLASKLFGLALNINTVRVSLVESTANLGITWIEFDREILRQLIISQNFDLYSTALYYNHYFELDNVTGLKKIPLSQFNLKVSSITDKTICLPQSNTKQKQSNLVDISISEAKLLAASIHDNQTLIDAIRQAEQNQMRTVSISKGLAAVLEEVTITNESAGTLMSEMHNEYTLSDYAQSEYEEYQVTEIIDESSLGFESALQTLIRNVVELESPISRDLLNRRICTAMGISRVSARLNEKIVSILSKMNLFTTQTDKIFYWSDSIRPDYFKIFRKGGKRDALDIAPEEVLNCIIYNIKQTGISDRSQVLRSVANEFGFTRMGVNVQASMEAGIICGINNGILTDEGGIISSTL